MATVNVPETAPLPFGPGVTMLHEEVPAAKSTVGAEVNVHVVAFDPKPFPVTETTAPKTPFAGVTVRVGTTVNVAVRIVGSPGFPVTVTVNGDPSAVANGLTIKVPVAVPPEIEHATLFVSTAPLGEVVEVTVHDVSVLSRPLPTNDTVFPGEPYVGLSISEGPKVMARVPTAVAPILSVTITW